MVEKNLLELIEAGEVEQTFIRLKESIKTFDNDQQDELIIFSNQWETLKRRIKEKTISEADRDLNHSRIVVNLLNFIKKVQ